MKKEIKFDRWVSWHEGDSLDKAPIGGMGGWFNSNLVHKPKEPTTHVWKDYIDTFKGECHLYLQALKEEILRCDYQITGEQHQAGYVPVFSDGKAGLFTYRGWGDFMAAIYSTKEKPLSYMEYYM